MSHLSQSDMNICARTIVCTVPSSRSRPKVRRTAAATDSSQTSISDSGLFSSSSFSNAAQLTIRLTGIKSILTAVVSPRMPTSSLDHLQLQKCRHSDYSYYNHRQARRQQAGRFCHATKARLVECLCGACIDYFHTGEMLHKCQGTLIQKAEFCVISELLVMAYRCFHDFIHFEIIMN